MECWAECLGDCGGRQSEEHYVSQSVIGYTHVTVSGLSFLGGQPRTLPAKRLAKNMLCERHNTQLSPLDAAAGHFFRVISAFMKRGAMRARGGKKRGGPDFYRIDGALLERWLLKTVVNVMYGRDAIDGFWKPPDLWVKCIYGHAAFPTGCGFYFLEGEHSVQQRDHGAVGLRLLTRSMSDTTLIGGQFSMEDLQFVVAMTPLQGGYRIPWFRERRLLRLLQLIHFDWSKIVTS